MHDNFDEMYKGAKTPEAIAAIDGLWEQAKVKRGGVKCLGQDGVFDLRTSEGKDGLLNFIKGDEGGA